MVVRASLPEYRKSCATRVPRVSGRSISSVFSSCASDTRTKSLFTLPVTRKKWRTTKWKAGKTDLSYGYETVVRRVCAKVTGVRREYVQSVSSVFPSTLGIVNRFTKVRVINIDRLKQLAYRIYIEWYKKRWKNERRGTLASVIGDS